MESDGEFQEISLSDGKRRRSNDLWNGPVSTNDHAVPQRRVQPTMVAVRSHVVQKLTTNLGTLTKNERHSQTATSSGPEEPKLVEAASTKNVPKLKN